MPTTYNYGRTTGGVGTVEAENPADALRKAMGQSDAAAHTGVMAPTLPAPQDTTDTSSADPTIASSPVRRYVTDETGKGSGSTLGQVDDYYAGLERGPVDENAIRNEMRERAQGQLDAIEKGYASILAQDDATGEGNMGRERAGAARSGLLGSDFGNAALDRTARENDRVKAADEAAKASQIATILQNVDDRSDARITAEKTLRATNGAAYAKHLEDVATASRSDVINLSKSGVSFDKLSNKQYKTLLDQTGYTPEQLKAQFILNKPDPIFKGTVGSKYIVTSLVDGKPKTESFDLGFTPPQDYDSQTLDTGQVIFTPKNWDGDPTKIITYGAPSAKYLAETRKLNADAANAEVGGGQDGYTIPKTNRNNLLKAGLSGGDIDTLQSDIRQYGLKKALEGLDQTTRDTIQRELDKDYAITQ